MDKKLHRGFTLIELLVVVVIIGVLATIVVASLNSASKKGKDAGIKSNLVDARAQGEIFYNTNTVNPLSYIDVCTNGVVGGAQGIGAAVYAATQAAGLANFTNDAASSISQAVCNDDPSGAAWASEVPLRQGGFWCVDSTNASKYKATSGLTAGNDYVCG